ncbi:beta-1,3-galactosyltransferase brn-like [Argopecten irradians]|uniref:beta-1,3-galactosyltransferase brn-like n=1 Tax=Argopecten irradians TaxID=31199 RepID=UPI00371CF6DA
MHIKRLKRGFKIVLLLSFFFVLNEIWYLYSRNFTLVVRVHQEQFTFTTPLVIKQRSYITKHIAAHDGLKTIGTVKTENRKLEEKTVKPVNYYATQFQVLKTEDTNNSKGENRNAPKKHKAIPFKEFRYPLEVDLHKLVDAILVNGTVAVQPINIYPFSFLESMEEICGSSQKIFLLFLIKSAPGNSQRRRVIRETWANRTYFNSPIIRHVFLLAKTKNTSIYDNNILEKRQNHDIVEMSFIDAYYNNTYKTIGGINWCVKYCSTAKFVMLVDDDMYVATDYILDYLQGLPDSRTLFMGRKCPDSPQRETSKKWYMSYEEYPYDKYPPLLSAGAIIMSMDFVQRLQIGIQYTKRFKFDDVFLAIVSHKLGVQPKCHAGFRILPISYRNKMFKNVLVAHGFGNSRKLRMAWDMHKSKTNGSLS